MSSDVNTGRNAASSFPTWADFLEQHGDPDESNSDDVLMEAAHQSVVGFRFKRHEIGIYGKNPASDSLQLVECKVCHRLILLQAFHSHYTVRHMNKVCSNPHPARLQPTPSFRVKQQLDRVSVKSTRHRSVGSSRSAASLAKLESKGFIVDEQVTVVESGNRNEKLRMKSPVVSRVIVHNNAVYSSGKVQDSRHKGSISNVKKKQALPPPNMQKVKTLGFDPNRHCGVWMSDQKRHCVRSLTCKTHGLGLRRAVPGRRKDFDILLAEHRFRSNQLKGEQMMSSPEMQPSLKRQHNRVMQSPTSPAKKSAKKEPSDSVSNASDSGLNLGLLLEKGLKKNELTVSSDQPCPTALCDYGGRQLHNGHVWFGSLEGKMRCHLMQLKEKGDEKALVKRQPCNLGKPLDLHDDKSQHRVNIPAIHCHPSLLTQHLTNHLDGSQTPQPNDWPPIQPHSSVLLGSLGALTGNDQMLTSTSMGINCKPKTNAVQRGGRQHCSRPSHHANSTGQFQMNRQINGDVSLLLQQQQQQQQALVVSQYSVPNGLMATVVDMQSQQIMKQSGLPVDTQGVLNISVPRQPNTSQTHSGNCPPIVPNQVFNAQYHPQFLQQQQLQLQLLPGNTVDPQQQLLPSPQTVCLAHFPTQTLSGLALQRHSWGPVRKQTSPRKPGKLDLSSNQCHTSKEMAVTELSSYSMSTTSDLPTDNYHLCSPLMQIAGTPSLPTPATITQSPTLVHSPGLLPNAIPPGNQ